jgi:hypothetical protein
MPSSLEQYAREYVATFNQILPNLPPSPYTQRLIEARIFPAGNDAVIFFLPEDVAHISPNFLPQTRSGFLPLSADGLSRAPANDQPLTDVLQAATYNCLKVAIRPDTPILAGKPRELIQPPDLPREHLLCSGSLNPEWLGIPTDQDSPVAVRRVLPTAEVRNGQIIRELPTRKHVFSPLIRLTDGRLVRQHTWTCADVLFASDALDLDADKAREFATADALALHIAAAMEVFTQPFYERPHKTVAERLLVVCQQLQSLIDTPGMDERNVQALLEQDNNRFLLRPDAQEIYPQRGIGHGHYVTDFICQRPDGDYHFIEIENPNKPIYQKSNGEASAHLNHAMTQVKDWLRYVNDNRDTVRREDKLEGIYRPTGEVIAGRNAHLNEAARERFDAERADLEKMGIKIRTYDMLLRDVRSYATNLARFSASEQVFV